MTFAFILPVVHPQGNKVSNYHHVEIALKQTLKSLKRQTYRDVKIIVVCCQIPSWADQLGDNVYFLNVSQTDIFAPNRNDVRVDKGLKYILGILYAAINFKPSLYMLADADDYVDTRIADYSLQSLKGQFGDNLVDGYLISKGLQVEVSVPTEGELTYQNAYLVRKFNASCGTCRIFKAESLNHKLLNVHSNIFEASKQWLAHRQENKILVPSQASIWLDSLCNNHYLEKWHIVNILGRHIDQEDHFNFIPFPKVGAAKACGHGNHDGPRKGSLHQDKIIGKLPIDLFKGNFGIQDKGVFNFDFLADFFFKVKFYLN